MKLTNLEKTAFDIIINFYKKFNEYPSLSQIKEMNVIKTPYLYKIIASLIKKNKIEKVNNTLKIIKVSEFDKINHIGIISNKFNEYIHSDKKIELLSKYLINGNDNFIHCILNTNSYSNFNMQKGDALVFEKNSSIEINNIILIRCNVHNNYIIAEYLNKSKTKLHICIHNSGNDKKSLSILETKYLTIVGKLAYLYRISSS